MTTWEVAGGVQPRGEVSRYGPYLIHWRERPGTGQTVLLMAGCGLAMEFWRDVVRRLAGRHLLAYDRPGLGGTRWPGHLPVLADEVATAAALITARGRPAVLVAHSMAAFHAEALARLHPDLVSGVVFLDGSTEWLAKRPRTSSVQVAHAVDHLVGTLGLGSVASLVWRLGTFVQSNWDYRRLGFGRIPAIYRDRNALAMATAESLAYEEQAWDLLQVRAEHPYPKIPTVVLTASDNGPDEIAGQARLAALLGGRQIVVDDSRHLMMLDRSDIVAAAVETVAG